MKKIVISIILLLISVSVYAKDYHAVLIRVIDGDTIVIANIETREKIRVRLYGIDCPEMNQPYGVEAKEILIKHIEDSPLEVKELSTGKYGRKICKIKVKGIYLSEILLLNGLAWVYEKYYKGNEYQVYQKYAKNNKRGIWSQNNPIPPWKWRRGKRQ